MVSQRGTRPKGILWLGAASHSALGRLGWRLSGSSLGGSVPVVGVVVTDDALEVWEWDRVGPTFQLALGRIAEAQEAEVHTPLISRPGVKLQVSTIGRPVQLSLDLRGPDLRLLDEPARRQVLEAVEARSRSSPSS
jgi:hypothetical protein